MKKTVRRGAWALVTVLFATATVAESVCVRPENTDDVLINPDMGLVMFHYSNRQWAYGQLQERGDVLDTFPGVSTVYFRLPWCLLEPEEGRFRWDLIDSYAAPWIAAGKQVGFRVTCCENRFPYATPEWVRRKGAKGWFCRHPMQKVLGETVPGGDTDIWEPDYGDGIFLAELEKFLAKMAERYDGDPSVAFIDIGSIGMWGEGHTRVYGREMKKAGKNPEEAFHRHYELYRRLFPRTTLLCIDDQAGAQRQESVAETPLMRHALELGFGFRDDSILVHTPELVPPALRNKPWWFHEGWAKTFAPKAPVFVEHEHYSLSTERGAWSDERLVESVKDYRATWLSLHGWPDELAARSGAAYEKAARLLGYRFELREVTYPREVRMGEACTIASTWANVGVARRYKGATLAWSLVDAQGRVAWVSADDAYDFAEAQPKAEGKEHPVSLKSRCTFGFRGEIPQINDGVWAYTRKMKVGNYANDSRVPSLESGEYTLCVSLGTRTGKPQIALPLKGGCERRYPIGKIRLADGTDKAAPDRGETFFGVDAASSWLGRSGTFRMPKANGESHAYVVDKVAETGFRYARERLSWNDVNPAPGKWNFSHYLRVADLYRKRGLKMSGMFHDAPAWMKKNGKLPVDLKALYEFCRKASETFGDVAVAWEFWNEEDIGFCEASAWDYAAAAKAAYLGFKDAARERPALMGALCKGTRGPYDRALFDNDLALYTDAFNFHTYTALRNYDRTFGALHDFMAERGMGNLAIWTTETGTHQEGLGPHDGAMAGCRAHSPEQEALHAEIAAKSQFGLMMQGVCRDYFFCFPPYNEMGGGKDWGIMRRNGTLKPAAKMFADMIAAVGDSRMVGAVDVGTTNVLAYAFRQPNGRFTLAYVSAGPADRQENVTATDGAPLVSFSFGGRSLVAEALPKYLADLADLTVSRPARPRGRLGAPAPAPDEDRRLVLQARLDPTELALGGGKSAVEISGSGARIRLVVYNFEDCAKTGRVTCTIGRVRGLPETIALPAWGKTELTLDYEANPEKTNERLVFGGLFGGRRISRLSMNVINMNALRREFEAVDLDMKDDARWIKNDSASTFETRFDPAEGARLFHLVWKRENDRWAYPQFRLGKDDLKGGQMIEFEIRSEQDKVENDFRCAHVYLFKKNGNGHALSFAPPLGRWEVRRIDISGEKDLDLVDRLGIGANPCGRNLTYRIRNVRLYRKRNAR